MQDHLPGLLRQANEHEGAGFVEILQNCIVYHDEAFGPITDKKVSAGLTVRVSHGEPMLFGTNSEKGLRFHPDRNVLEIVDVPDPGSVDHVTRPASSSRAKSVLRRIVA